MASYILYPPIVDSYMPAFKAGTASCRIYFSLSKFNSSSDFVSVHATVVKQNTGMSAVKTTDSNGKYRSTGIILNIKPVKVVDENNLYYIEIDNDDLSSQSGDYSGWIPGWTYKVQLRLSTKNYDGSVGQAAWLKANASEFSEWSTICIVKATGKIDYTIPLLGIDTRNENSNVIEEVNTIYTTTLNLFGHFYRDIDPSELIYSYQFTLFDINNNVIEDSGTIYANKMEDSDSFNYLMSTELINGENYKLAFKFETLNHYVDGFYKVDEKNNIDQRIEFTVSQILLDKIDCELIVVDYDTDDILKDVTSVHEEEEEGRICVKIYSANEDIYNGNICIRRTDSRTNFKKWTDVLIYVAKEQLINTIPLFYDYTVESGVWYQYGIQQIDQEGNRGELKIIRPIMRNFNYTFLLGKNNQQLKLQFDNTMNSYKHQIVEGKVDPIGAQFPVVSRNAATNYKTFPINGLISFWMDENKLFCDKKVIYKDDDIINLYENYNKENNIIQYDYIYERDFRQKVLDFLYNGEIKLFKSPTEGNILVRLTDISCVPNQSLDRMIYSFSANAYQMAESTMEKYHEYGLYDTGTWSSDFSVYETHLGQLQMDFPVETNILKEIYKKYDSQGRNLGGYTKEIGNITNLKITFDGKPLRIKNSSGELVIGNNLVYNGKLFTVNSGTRVIEFDERMIFSTSDNLTLLGDEENTVSSVSATIDFLYEIRSEVWKDKSIQTRNVVVNIGQLFNEYAPDSDLYNEIYYKYYIDWEDIFRKLNKLSSIEIEANPGAVFYIKDEDDNIVEKHIIGETGQLRFYELSNIKGIKYAGMQLPDGSIDTTKKADILLNYIYTLVKGTYKKEI